ncbi:PucR family transcriptional regulator [Terribacillus aidingensis]|nr:PucR family transcriptional regulator [Terribacillus aidingensis]
MGMEAKLSVKDILCTKHFKDAKVVAGHDGLQRLIRWVHVLEVTAIDDLLHGNELILSTGVGWKEGHVSFYSLVEEFIRCNAAGICIELGTYISEIPPTIIELANKHGFPIITFAKQVKFIDITHEIHSLLIQRHYQILTDLEHYSNSLNQLLLSSSPHRKILHLLHDQLKVTVYYIPAKGDVEVIPLQKSSEKMTCTASLKEHLTAKPNVSCQPVQAGNHIFADLFIVSADRELTQLDHLILNRSATALAQIRMRDLYFEEQRREEDGHWISSWLKGEYSEVQLQSYLLDMNATLNVNSCTVMLFKTNQIAKVKTEFTYYKMYARTIFERKGIYPFMHIEKDTVIFILVNMRKDSDFKCRVQEVIQHLREGKFANKEQFSQSEWSVGKIVTKLSLIKNSYHTAKETMNLRKQLPNELLDYFYEDLYIFRLVLAAQDQGVLQDFIYDYIGPVLEHDQGTNGELLKTLKVYLRCKGAKKETAEQLHIVRQTLYHRLERLYELIGQDFMEPYKRQAIEASIAAYDYTSASKLPNEYQIKFS